MPRTPEDEAREQIDGMLNAAGWAVQDAAKASIHASRGVALRNFALKTGHGFADYLLYVDGAAAGVVEAKKAGTTLTGVEIQSAKYSEGLPSHLPAPVRPLPFCYQSTGVETHFTNGIPGTPYSISQGIPGTPEFRGHHTQFHRRNWYGIGNAGPDRSPSARGDGFGTRNPLHADGGWGVTRERFTVQSPRPQRDSRVERPGCQGPTGRIANAIWHRSPSRRRA